MNDQLIIALTDQIRSLENLIVKQHEEVGARLTAVSAQNADLYLNLRETNRRIDQLVCLKQVGDQNVRGCSAIKQKNRYHRGRNKAA